MDIYHVWCDIEGDVTDKEWVHNLREFLKSLKDSHEEFLKM